MAVAAVLTLAFQNCTENGSAFRNSSSETRSASVRGGDGFDGKVYVELQPSANCGDGSRVKAKIVLSSETSGALVRENCSDIASLPLGPGDFVIDPLNRDLLSYKGRIFTAISPESYWQKVAGTADIFYAPASSSMTGKVGIGTANPTQALHVATSGNQSSAILIENSSTGGAAAAIVGAANDLGSTVFISVAGSGVSGPQSIHAGIDLKNWVSIAASSGADGMMIGPGSDRPIVFVNNNAERMRVDTTGNIGIGTTAPTEKLHVTGHLRVQGTTDCTLGSGAGATNCSSDIRLKDNVTPIENALDKIARINGVEFDWNHLALKPGRHSIGVIAQDVQKVFPTAVVENASGYLAVDYAVLISPLIEATKELKIRCESSNTQLAKQVADLQSENIAIKTENADIKRENAAVKAYLCAKDPSAPFCNKKN